MTTKATLHVQKVVSGVTWGSASQSVRQATSFLASILLARLIAPEDFGLVSLASAAVGFASIFRDMGTSSALIQKKDVSVTFYSSLFWINCGIGMMLVLLLTVAAPLVARFFSEPTLSPLIHVLSINLFFSCLLSIPLTLMVRNLEFDRVAKTEIVANLLGAAVAILAALQGWKAWALVAQSLANTLTTALLVMGKGGFRPTIRFDWHEVRPVINYSLNLTGFNILNYGARNLDNLIIGKILGAQSLGYYALAYRLLLLPIQSVSDVVGRVMFPILSSMQDNLDLLRLTYRQMLGKIALFTFPMMLGLWAVRHQFIPTIYGEHWNMVAGLLFFLAPVGMIQSIGTTVGMIYQIKGRTDLLLYSGIIVNLLLIPVFWFGAQHGVEGVAMAYALASLALVVPCFFLPCRLIEMPIRHVFSSVASIFWPTLTMSILVHITASMLSPGHGSWLNLMSLVVMGALTYFLLLNLFKVRTYLEVKDTLRKQLIALFTRPVEYDAATMERQQK